MRNDAGRGRGRVGRVFALALLACGGGAAGQPCAQWVFVDPPPGAPTPSARWVHRMAYDSDRHVVVMANGYDNANFLSDTWEYDCATRLWSKRSAGPPPSVRAEAAMLYDAARMRTWLFSGAHNLPQGAHHQPGFHFWDGSAWTFLNPPGPSARHGHGLAFDTARDVFVLYGSKHGERDTWEYDPKTNIWAFRTDALPTLPHAYGAMGYDASRQRTVHFGGYDATIKGGPAFAQGGTWEWDGNGWTLANPAASPSARYAVVGVYDSTRRKFVILGGYPGTGNAYLSDAWAYDGATWTQIDAPGLPGRQHAGIAFDSRRGRIVVFGGHRTPSGAMGDTWELAFDPYFTAQPQSQSVSQGEPAVFMADAATSGAGPIGFQWLHDEKPIEGAVFPTLMIPSVGPEDAGVYVCRVNGACGVIYSQEATLTTLGACPGDANGDRVIDFSDLNIVLANFGATGPSAPGDVNHDGVVNFVDLNIVLSFFGVVC